MCNAEHVLTRNTKRVSKCGVKVYHGAKHTSMCGLSVWF